jgi:hypothetical protein
MHRGNYRGNLPLIEFEIQQNERISLQRYRQTVLHNQTWTVIVVVCMHATPLRICFWVEKRVIYVLICIVCSSIVLLHYISFRETIVSYVSRAILMLFVLNHIMR